jgi:hypothetical protein
VFENRVLRRIFGPKRDEVTGEWSEQQNREFRGLYSSPSIIRMTKSRRMRWVGHVARMWYEHATSMYEHTYKKIRFLKMTTNAKAFIPGFMKKCSPT